MSTITWTQDDVTKNHIGTDETGGICLRIDKTPGKRYNVYNLVADPAAGPVIKNIASLPNAKVAAEALLNGTPIPVDAATAALPKNAAELKEVAKGTKIVGEVIAWTPGEGTRTHHAIVSALTGAGLDPKVARDLLPRNAFSRACTQLEKDRVIDAAPEHNIGDILAYQFSKKRMVNCFSDPKLSKEWTYDIEAILHVNRDTGKVWCKDAALMEQAQKLVDEAMVNRTASDVTRIVQKLFDTHADLFPIREQGGAYFVPFEHLTFVGQVEGFLQAIGGRISRFPIAEPGAGNKSVAEAVADGLDALIQDHEAAVADFGFSTHETTLKATADRIKATRVKIEAYASYLEDKKADLLKSVDAANALLMQKITDITQNKPAVTPSTKEDPRDAFGNKIGSVGHKALAVIAACETAVNMKGIMEDAGLADTCYNLVKAFIEKGIVEQAGKCFRLTEKGRKLYNPALYSC